MQLWLGLVTASCIFPTLNVTAHLKTLFCYREEFIAHPATTLRATRSLPPSEVTCSAHLQTYGSVFFVLCSLYFIVFCIVIVQFDCFHCIERVWCFIVLNECLRPQTVLRLVAFWQKRFKINFDHKRKTFSFVTAKRKTVQKPELESAPQRETQTQQRAWFSWHGAACGAVRNSHTRRRPLGTST